LAQEILRPKGAAALLKAARVLAAWRSFDKKIISIISVGEVHNTVFSSCNDPIDGYAEQCRSTMDGDRFLYLLAGIIIDLMLIHIHV